MGISATVLFFALLVVGFPHYRQWRRSRALKRALKEVESGIQIQQDKACAVADGVNVPTGACAKPVNDNMVLESRVEIIVEEDKSDAGGDAVRSWNGWDARGSLEGEGRKGMSLPRKTE